MNSESNQHKSPDFHTIKIQRDFLTNKPEDTPAARPSKEGKKATAGNATPEQSTESRPTPSAANTSDTSRDDSSPPTSGDDASPEKPSAGGHKKIKLKSKVKNPDSEAGTSPESGADTSIGQPAEEKPAARPPALENVGTTPLTPSANKHPQQAEEHPAEDSSTDADDASAAPSKAKAQTLKGTKLKTSPSTRHPRETAAPQAQPHAAPLPDQKPAGRPTLHHPGTKLPANLSTPPPQSASNKGKANRKQKKGGKATWAALTGSLTLFIAANGVALSSVWRAWINGGATPSQELIVLGVTTAIMGLLILSRKLALRILAAFILVSLVMYCAGAVIVPRFFWDLIPSDLISPQDIHVFGPPAIMLGSAVLFLGAFFLCLGSGVVQWFLASVCIAAAVGSYWLPIEDYLPENPAAPVAVELGQLNIVLPETWMRKPLEGGKGDTGSRFFQTVDGKLALRLSRTKTDIGMSVGMFAERKLDEYRDKRAVASFDVENNPLQKRLVVFGDERIEVLVVKKPDAFYCAEVSGDPTSIKANPEKIKEVFSLFD